jgi:hypothetical protein
LDGRRNSRGSGRWNSRQNDEWMVDEVVNEQYLDLFPFCDAKHVSLVQVLKKGNLHKLTRERDPQPRIARGTQITKPELA